MSAAPIPWPIGEKNGQRALIVFKGLARALRFERAESIAEWWRIDIEAVRRWQSGERIPLVAVRPSEQSEPPGDDPDDSRKAWQLDDELADQAPLPAAPAHAATLPEPWSPAGDALIDVGPNRKRRWEAWEDDLVRTCSVQEVVLKTQRKVTAVWARRYRLGVSALRRAARTAVRTPVATSPARSHRSKWGRASRV
jgi:hypothetical protein